MSKIEVDAIDKQSGSTLTLGGSGTAVTLACGATQSGFGRTGRMWACEHWNTTPDIMCLAKGIAGGVPMGATLVRPDILACMSKGEHSSTFGGNPLSCAAGIGAIQALTKDGLIENADKMGKKFSEGLKQLKEKHIHSL